MSSYGSDEHELFHGRDTEIELIVERLSYANLVCLYGPSGVGKTSILQAGVGRRLREVGGFPVFLRLDHSDGSPTLVRQIADRLMEAAQREGLEAAVTSPSIDPKGVETLWELLHRIEFWTARNKQVRPILILDQFEEIFTLSSSFDRVRRFVRELRNLAENRPPPGLLALIGARPEPPPYSLDATDYRVVISLREDFLAQLEAATSGMSSFRDHRIPLLPLDGEKALEVVRIPGAGLLEDGVASAIIESVTVSSSLEPTTSVHPLSERKVAPTLLSLFCAELNEQRIQLCAATITLDQVHRNAGDILKSFYRTSIGSMSSEIAELLECKLLTESGYRNSVAVEDLVAAGVSKEVIEHLVARHLLDVEIRQGLPRVEFSHDILTKVAVESRQERRLEHERELAALERKQQEAELVRERELAALERERRRRFRQTVETCAIAASVFLVLVIGLSYFTFWHVDTWEYGGSVTRVDGFPKGDGLGESADPEKLGKCAVRLQRNRRYASLASFLRNRPEPFTKMEFIRSSSESDAVLRQVVAALDPRHGRDSTRFANEWRHIFAGTKRWWFARDDSGRILKEVGYDSSGRILYQLHYAFEIHSGPTSARIAFYTDGSGRPLSIVDCRQVILRIDYDSRGNEIGKTFLDSAGASVEIPRSKPRSMGW